MFSIAHFSTNWIIFQSLHFKETALLTTNPEDPSHRNVTSLFEFVAFVSKIVIYCSCSTRMTKHTMTYLNIWPVHCLNIVVQLYFSVWFFVFIVDSKKTIIDLIVISWKKNKNKWLQAEGGCGKEISHLIFWKQSSYLLVIRRKCESQNECYKKKKHAKFSEKQTFRAPDIHTYVCSFFGKFGVFCFLVLHVLRFILLPYYRRIFL